MKNMKYRNKLLIVFIVLAILFISTGGISIYFSSVMQEKNSIAFEDSKVMNDLNVIIRNYLDGRIDIMAIGQGTLDIEDSSFDKNTFNNWYNGIIQSDRYETFDKETKEILTSLENKSNEFFISIEEFVGNEIITPNSSSELKDIKPMYILEEMSTLSDQLRVKYLENEESLIKEAKRYYSNMIIILIGVAIFNTFIAISGLIILLKFIKPIGIMTNRLKEIGEGEGDLTQRIIVKSNDEMGELAKYFNMFMFKLQEMIKKVSKEADLLANSSGDMSNISDSSIEATKQVATAIQEVAKKEEVQLQGSNETLKAMEEMTKGVNNISENSAIVSDEANKTAVDADQGNEKVKKAVIQMQSLDNSTRITANSVKQLGERSKEIGAIIEVINSIADQTNLLALNASIEAARAGEHGKGFAVVADEVKNLAEQSKVSSEQISKLIQDIQSETNTTVEGMNEVIDEVNLGVDVVNQAGEAFERILISTKQIASQIQEITAISQEMFASSEEITSSSERMNEVANEFVISYKQITASTEEQTIADKQFAEAAESLKTTAYELQKLFKMFKV